MFSYEHTLSSYLSVNTTELPEELKLHTLQYQCTIMLTKAITPMPPHRHAICFIDSLRK